MEQLCCTQWRDLHEEIFTLSVQRYLAMYDVPFDGVEGWRYVKIGFRNPQTRTLRLVDYELVVFYQFGAVTHVFRSCGCMRL